MADCPSRFTLASLRAGDLSQAEAGKVEAHVERCADCRATLDEIDSNVAEYEPRAADHLARLLARIEREPPELQVAPPRAGRSGVVKVTIAVGGLAVAAMLALVLVPALTDPGSAEDRADIRFKGALALELVAKRDDRQFRVAEGTELLPGDALRFVVSTGAPGWIAVFSIDGNGRRSQFYPDTEPATDPDPLRIAAGGRHELPGSIILDEARGHEDIVTVFARARFDRDMVQKAVTDALGRRGIAPQLGPGFTVRIVRVIKGSP
jgi:hypothetical protein